MKCNLQSSKNCYEALNHFEVNREEKESATGSLYKLHL